MPTKYRLQEREFSNRTVQTRKGPQSRQGFGPWKTVRTESQENAQIAENWLRQAPHGFVQRRLCLGDTYKISKEKITGHLTLDAKD